MIPQTSKKLFVFFAGIFLVISFSSSVFAQSDGSAPPAGTATTGASPADASVPVLSPAETAAVPVAASPRAVSAPAASISSPTAAPVTAPTQVIPRGTTTSAPRPAPAPAPLPKSESNQMPVVLPPTAPTPESTSSFPYTLVALATLLLLAPYGMSRLANNSKKEEKKSGNRCDEIKKLLEQKKSTLEVVSGTLSVKQLLVDLLVKKIEKKKAELEDKVVTVVIDEALGEEGGKIIRSAKEAEETYEALVENLEQAKRALEYFTNRQKQLSEDVGKIESAYQVCQLGNSVFEGASRLSKGLELFEAGLHQKLYRYTSQEKDVFSHEAVLASNLAEMADAGKWLPSPNLPEGTHQFFLTEKGREEYEKALFPLHKKYLSDISCEETDASAIDGVVYEDEWQVVVKKDQKKHS